MKEGIKKIFASKSKTFAIICFCFLLGVAVASFADIRLNQLYCYVIFLTPLFLWFVLQLFDKKFSREFLLYGGIVYVFIFGLARYAFVFPPNAKEFIHFYAGQKVELVGYIATEPDERIDSVRYIVETETILNEVEGDKNIMPRGRVYLKYDRYPRFNYGDRLRVNCNLKIPTPIVDATESSKVFHYDKYLALSNVFSLCEYPRIGRITGSARDPIYALLLQFKQKIASQIGLLWPEPYASFMAGLLYGYRGGLGSLNEAFNRTGVTHIVAVSGFNISIIASILINLCTVLTVPRQKTFWLVAMGIVAFVIFTGASASVVRAGVMGIITLLAAYVGRPKQIANVLLLAAVIMIAHNPLVLWFDAGFQLSFLSTLGLVYVAPKIKPFLQAIPESVGLRENLGSTLSAIIATTPLVIGQFGRFSLVAPLVNILVLWIIPYLMIFGATSVVINFTFPFLSFLVVWPTMFGMRYVIFVVTWFSQLSWASVSW